MLLPFFSIATQRMAWQEQTTAKRNIPWIPHRRKVLPSKHIRRSSQITLRTIPHYNLRSASYPHQRGTCRRPVIFARVRPGIKSAGIYSSCIKKWRCFHVGNPNLLPLWNDCPGDQRRAGSRGGMLMYGKEASNRKQEIDRQHYTIPNQRPKDKHLGNMYNLLFRHGKVRSQNMEKLKGSLPTSCKQSYPQFHEIASYTHYAQCRLLRNPSHSFYL